MVDEPVKFEHSIQLQYSRFGGWTYVIRLSEDKSRPSKRFPTHEAALRDANEMLSYMR